MQVPTRFTPKQIEEAKHEQFERDVPRGLQPGNPYTFRPYPAMVYKAQQIPPGFPGAGKHVVALQKPNSFSFHNPQEWQQACEMAETFTASCQLVVGDKDEHKRARDQGWRDSQQEALEFQASLDKLVSDAAGVRNWEDRNMGAKAQAERDKAEAENFGHLGEIPEKPIVRRVKKQKGKKEAA